MTLTPRLMVAAPAHERLHGFVGAWLDGLHRQTTDMRWDVLLVDGTPQPSDAYLDAMHALARQHVDGPHRIRLKRFGAAEDGRVFVDAAAERRYAHRVILDCFTSSLSYDHLLMLDLDVALRNPQTIDALCYGGEWTSLAHASDRAMAAALLDGAMVRAVPFPMNSLPSDAAYVQACMEAGYTRSVVGVRDDMGCPTGQRIIDRDNRAQEAV